MEESRFSNMSSVSRHDYSSRGRNSINDVLRYKLEHAKDLWREFNNMVEVDNGVRNETFLDFTRYIKNNSDYIKSLTVEIKERSPVTYAKFPVEANEQYKISLENELTELTKMIELRKKENLILKKLQRGFARKTDEINKVVDEAESKKEEEETIDAIERKLLDLKFKDSKNKLSYILTTAFPEEHVAVSNLLEKLFNDGKPDDNDDRWIDLGDEDYALVQCLLSANIIQMNDEDQFRLLKS